MKRFLTSVAIVALMASAPAPAPAHSDRKLDQTLAGADGIALKHYRQVSLHSQRANVYAWIGDHDKARDLLDSAGRASAVLGGYLRDDSLAALANEQASTGDFAGALARMAEIGDTDARVKLGWKLVSKLAKADRKAEAQALLDGIRDQAIALFAEAGKLGATLDNPLERAQSFAMLGGERAALKDNAKARTLLDRALTENAG